MCCACTGCTSRSAISMRPEQIALCYGSVVAYLAEIYFAAPIRRPAPRARAAATRDPG